MFRNKKPRHVDAWRARNVPARDVFTLFVM